MKQSFTKTARLSVTGLVLSIWVVTASAQITTNSYTFSPNQIVPDDNFSGIALTTNLTGMDGIITNITISLDITNGFNGDLYAYLRGPNGGFAILLNRVGVTNGNPFGYSDSGFNVTFDDSSGYTNIHFYQSFSYDLNGEGQLTGTWSSDGRDIDPLSDPSAFATNQPSAFLDSFDGTNPNGTWTLFLADLNGGGQSTLVNWHLNIETVPEPPTSILLGIGAAIFLTALKRVRHARRTACPHIEN